MRAFRQHGEGRRERIRPRDLARAAVREALKNQDAVRGGHFLPVPQGHRRRHRAASVLGKIQLFQRDRFRIPVIHDLRVRA